MQQQHRGVVPKTTRLPQDSGIDEIGAVLGAGFGSALALAVTK
jgi:hypothetical protein